MKVELPSCNNMKTKIGDSLKVAAILTPFFFLGCNKDSSYNQNVSIYDDEKISIHQDLGYSAFDNVYITYKLYENKPQKEVSYQVSHSFVFEEREFKEWLDQVYKIDVLLSDNKTPIYLSPSENRIYYSEKSFANLYYFCYKYCQLDFDMSNLVGIVTPNQTPQLRLYFKNGKTSIVTSATPIKGRGSIILAKKTIEVMDSFTHSISNQHIHVNPPMEVKYPFELAFHIKDAKGIKEASFMIESPEDKKLSYKIEDGKQVDYKVILATEDEIEVMGYFITKKPIQ